MWMIPLAVASVLGVASAAQAQGGPAYLALGDSYTIGEGVDPAQRWPAQLAQRLRDEDVAIDLAPIVAQTGWTTDELSAAMDAAELRGDYDLVSLLIGVNNQYRGRDLDNYRKEFAALLERAIDLSKRRPQRVLVLSFPDWGVTTFGRSSGRDTDRVARETDAYNAIAQAECSKRGVAFVDITPISRAAGAAAEMLTADGLHPSGQQYALWVNAAFPVAQRLLKTP